MRRMPIYGRRGKAIEAMGNLTLDQRIEVVKQMFRNADDKAELIAETGGLT